VAEGFLIPGSEGVMPLEEEHPAQARLPTGQASDSQSDFRSDSPAPKMGFAPDLGLIGQVWLCRRQGELEVLAEVAKAREL
jgi:hypothetical protein